MLTVVIPTLNAAADLPATLAAASAGLEAGESVVVVDGGSTDDTQAVALTAGARVVAARRGRGTQLAAGAHAAEGEWLLFLHADALPAPGWRAAADAFMAVPGNRRRAGFFRLAFDADHGAAQRVERLARWRARALGLPYGDQGLLIHRGLYQAVGGHPPLPLMEDVALARSLGRRRLVPLPATVVTSAARYRRDGWWLRPARNLLCLGLYLAGVPLPLVQRLYG